MTVGPDPLRDLAQWRAASDATRLAVARRVAHAVGGTAPELVGDAHLAGFTDAHGLPWVVVPGGQARLGLGPDEEAALLAAVRSTRRPAELDALFGPARPARSVAVDPFVITAVPVPVSLAPAGTPGWALTEGDHDLEPDEDWPATLTADAARALAAQLEARLPTDDEWEYVARAGGSGG
ncbi:MAG: SUMF1/EgtB/PvdO family nonheme iron enzyme, partial [Myxococcota bacterium]